MPSRQEFVPRAEYAAAMSNLQTEITELKLGVADLDRYLRRNLMERPEGKQK